MIVQPVKTVCCLIPPCAAVVALGMATATAPVVLPAASAATTYSPQATVSCDKAIARGAVIRHRILSTCEEGYIVGRQACDKAGEVVWLSGPGNVTVLLKSGKRPIGFTTHNFYSSSISKLCGDPIDPTETPPPAPMSAARLRHFFSETP